MSFPRLVLSGIESKFVITGIDLEYVDAEYEDLPRALIRSSYSINRETSVQGSSSGTAKRWADIPYTYMRRRHKWVGYIDVLTESVAFDPIMHSSHGPTLHNISLMQQALFLYTSVENAVFSQVPIFLPGDEGPGNPGTSSLYSKAYDYAYEWIYKKMETAPKTYTDYYCNVWIIKNINVADNMNSSSRVTFTLDLVEPWQAIAPLIDAL